MDGDQSKEDNIYYNILIKNKDTESRTRAVADFTENRVQPILMRPSDYEVAVVRFSVPMFELPLLFFRDGNPPFAPSQKYTLTLSFGGTDITKTLVFVQNEYPESMYGIDSIWNYNEMVSIINTAFKDAYTDLLLAEPTIPPTEAPFIAFFQDNETFSLYAEQLYDVDSVLPTVEIYFNFELFRLMSTLLTISHSGGVGGNPDKKFQMIVKDQNLNHSTQNGKPYYIMRQDSPTLYLWGELTSLIFETHAIPVNPELLPAQQNVIRTVLTDFEPVSDAPSREVIQFFPQGPLRWYDLNSAYPLRSIDMRVRWTDRLGISRPVFVTGEDALTVKLQFRRKKRHRF